MQKYDWPIPGGLLIKRFGGIFDSIARGRDVTLVALPYTGRTSHLRIISSNAQALKKFGIDPSSHEVILVDIDRTQGTHDSYLGELLRCLKDLNIEDGKVVDSFLLSQDAYLISQKINELVRKISKTKKLVFIVTLNSKAVPFIDEIDKFFVMLQKSTTSDSVRLMWSIDTLVVRDYRSGHPTSSLLEDTFYFPTFNEEETMHSIARSLLAKGEKLTPQLKSNAMQLTGGIAGLFHPLVSLSGKGLGEDDLRKTLLDSPVGQKVIAEVKRELTATTEHRDDLARVEAQDFLKTAEGGLQAKLGDISLLDNPTAQEINLLKKLRERIDGPLTRDEVAEALWGRAWQTKYSDWAIDKAVSRLRKKLKSPNTKILTVKNLGYQLFVL